MDNKAKIFLTVVGVLVVGVVVTAVMRGGGTDTVTSGKYDVFAQCLKDSGTIFYGAFWCPHCQAQKKLFGSSQKLLPYVECSTLDGKAMTEECRAKGIEGYPTWEFPDGSRLSGEVALSVLAEKSACPLRPSFSEASELPL